jgi:hypothetical protein
MFNRGRATVNYCYKVPLLFPHQNKKVRSVNFPKSTFKHANLMRRGCESFHKMYRLISKNETEIE